MFKSLVFVLIGQWTPDVIGRLSVKRWCYWLWRLLNVIGAFQNAPVMFNSACIFSMLTSTHILWYKLWEFVQTSSNLIFGDCFFHSDDLCVWLYGDIVSFADFSTALRNLSAHTGSHKRRTVSFLFLWFIVAVQYNIQYNLQQSQTILKQSAYKLTKSYNVILIYIKLWIYA